MSSVAFAQLLERNEAADDGWVVSGTSLDVSRTTPTDAVPSALRLARQRVVVGRYKTVAVVAPARDDDQELTSAIAQLVSDSWDD